MTLKPNGHETKVAERSNLHFYESCKPFFTFLKYLVFKGGGMQQGDEYSFSVFNGQADQG